MLLEAIEVGMLDTKVLHPSNVLNIMDEINDCKEFS